MFFERTLKRAACENRQRQNGPFVKWLFASLLCVFSLEAIANPREPALSPVREPSGSYFGETFSRTLGLFFTIGNGSKGIDFEITKGVGEFAALLETELNYSIHEFRSTNLQYFRSIIKELSENSPRIDRLVLFINSVELRSESECYFADSRLGFENNASHLSITELKRSISGLNSRQTLVITPACRKTVRGELAFENDFFRNQSSQLQLVKGEKTVEALTGTRENLDKLLGTLVVSRSQSVLKDVIGTNKFLDLALTPIWAGGHTGGTFLFQAPQTVDTELTEKIKDLEERIQELSDFILLIDRELQLDSEVDYMARLASYKLAAAEVETQFLRQDVSSPDARQLQNRKRALERRRDALRRELNELIQGDSLPENLTSSEPSPATTKRAQRALKMLGYYSGEIDGLLGDGTLLAVSQWRTATEGIQQVPQFDLQLIKRIEQSVVGEHPIERRDCEASCPAIVFVPAGTAELGTREGVSSLSIREKPSYRVSIATPFAVGVGEISRREWAACATAKACSQRPLHDTNQSNGAITVDDTPITNVTWEDATEYTLWLSAITGFVYRLPTEAEWEYAARGGSKTAYWWGDKTDVDYAFFGKDFERGPRLVHEGVSQAFGLRNALGNVWEMVDDCDNMQNPRHSIVDVSRPRNGKCQRIIVRGGSWTSTERQIRLAARPSTDIDRTFADIGFRVLREL